MTAERQYDADDGAVLAVRDLHVAYGRGRRAAQVVDGVSFTVRRGRTLALVGESGAGKTTVARAVMGLLGDAHVSGRVSFAGRDVLGGGRGGMRDVRRGMQMIFQDPAGSLDPRMTVGQIVAEPLLAKRTRRRERRRRAEAVLDRVGLPANSAWRYPHEFSGGQRQRIAIARAIVAEPELIICDEPVSSLDVSILAQILNLLTDLQEQLHLSYLFIAHDLAVVGRFADDLAVMQRGRIVETGRVSDVLRSGGGHPYTQTLIGSILTIGAGDGIEA